MSDYICGNCKYYDSDICECSLHPEYEDMFEEDTCDDWTDDNEVELTEEEKQDIAGDIEAHRRMVED
ncbi:MAG: hypothetical protein Q8M94_11650 [Ignavibacteria bacterium]|nr:hypothetical protein [Ignavibacteria bacterium]